MAQVEFRNVEKFYDGTTPAIRALSLDVQEGEFMVLVGPSGCGKTTLMRMLAGLESITSGSIVIDGQVVNDRTPQQRNVAMVFQNYALYPHMSVRGNLEFPLRMLKMSKTEIGQRVGDAAQLLGLTALLDRKPRHLSGGQRQRVAMGRAIVRDPSVFLMDEPLSNLDARLRVQIRTEISSLQRRTRKTTFYVTHDQIEAMTLGDRVCVLNAGVLQQVASPLELYAHPVNVFVASFLGSPGMNLFPVRFAGVRDNAVTLVAGSQQMTLPAEALDVDSLEVGQSLLLGIRPEALGRGAASGDELGLAMEVTGVEALGHEILAYGRLPGFADARCDDVEALQRLGVMPGSVVARLPANVPVTLGRDLELAVGFDQVHFFGLDGDAL